MTSESIRTSGKLWAWVPAGLLGSMLLGLGSLTYIAVDDPHFALEPNYYDKAVHWDRAQAQARRSQETGVNVVLEPLTERGGVVEVRLRLVDRAGQALEGAAVLLEAFPNAYAHRVQKLTLREVAPGSYAGQLRSTEHGLWELRLSASRAELRFRRVLRQDVGKGGAA